MTDLTTANPCWPPPPVGPPRRTRRRTAGAPVIEQAVATTNDDTTPTPRPWFHHPLVTIGAFLIFPPLGLWLAIRHHALWQKHIRVRIAILAVTVAFIVLPFVANSSNDTASGIQDGAPIVAVGDPVPQDADTQSTTPPPPV